MTCKSLLNRKLTKSVSKFLALLLFVFVLFSCRDFDESLLYGKWHSGTLYYRYDPGYRGVTWDESDEVDEEDAQSFEWSLNGSELTHIHIMEMGGQRIPKVYKVTELTKNRLVYNDSNKSYYFKK